MLMLKHLKTLQHVSIIIQVIFSELVVSLLKSLNLKSKIVIGHLRSCCSIMFGVCVCVCVAFCVVRYVGESPTYLCTQNCKQSNISLHTELQAVQHISPHRTARSPTYLCTQNCKQSNISPAQNCKQSNISLHTERHVHTPNVMLPHRHNWPTRILDFKFGEFNKEHTISLKMVWIMIETCRSVLSFVTLTF